MTHGQTKESNTTENPKEVLQPGLFTFHTNHGIKAKGTNKNHSNKMAALSSKQLTRGPDKKRLRSELEGAVSTMTEVFPKIAQGLQNTKDELMADFLLVLTSISTALNALVEACKEDEEEKESIIQNGHPKGQGNDLAAPKAKTYSQVVAAKSNLRVNSEQKSSQAPQKPTWTTVVKRKPLLGNRKRHNNSKPTTSRHNGATGYRTSTFRNDNPTNKANPKPPKPQYSSPQILSNGSPDKSISEGLEDHIEGEKLNSPLSIVPHANDTGNSCKGGGSESYYPVFQCNESPLSGSQSICTPGRFKYTLGRKDYPHHGNVESPNVRIRKDYGGNQMGTQDNNSSPQPSVTKITRDTTGCTYKGDPGEASNSSGLIGICSPPKRPYKFRLITANLNGFKAGKSIRIRSLLEKHTATIAVLTETKQRLFQQLSGCGRPHTIQGEGDEYTGVAFVHPSGMDCNIISQHKRIIRATLPNNVHIIGVYGPNEVTTVKIRDLFWDKLDQVIAEATTVYSTTIIVGDLNAGHEPILSKQVGRCNYNRLKDIIDKHQLHLVESGPTWQSNASTKLVKATRTLDRCLIHCKGEYNVSATTDWEDRISDHAVLVLSLEFKDIDRNRGRPFSLLCQNPAGINAIWQTSKSKLQLKRPQVSDKAENPLRHFWNLRSKLLRSKHEGITLLDDSGNAYSPIEAIRVATNHLSQLWKAEDDDIYKFPIYNYSRPTSPPTLSEIKLAVSSLKRATAIGMDGISSDSVIDNPNSGTIYLNILSRNLADYKHTAGMERYAGKANSKGRHTNDNTQNSPNHMSLNFNKNPQLNLSKPGRQ